MNTGTPRTDAFAKTPCAPNEDVCVAWNNFACQLEHEFNAANERIKRLEEALSFVSVDCNALHHPKQYQHSGMDECPVEAIVRAAKNSP